MLPTSSSPKRCQTAVFHEGWETARFPPRAAILLMTSRAHLPDDIKGLLLELSFPCLQQDQCLSCRVCCSCGSVLSVTCYTPCTLQKKIEKVEVFCAKAKKKGRIFRDVFPTPELNWAITTVSTALPTVSLHQNFGGSRLLPACRFDRAPLLCVPVLPQQCHPCFGTVVVGAVGTATNGSIASG